MSAAARMGPQGTDASRGAASAAAWDCVAVRAPIASSSSPVCATQPGIFAADGVQEPPEDRVAADDDVLAFGAAMKLPGSTARLTITM
ncbi:hypothetical protein [Amycolatopsis stemonae]